MSTVWWDSFVLLLPMATHVVQPRKMVSLVTAIIPNCAWHHVPFPQEQNKRLENEGHKSPDQRPQGCAAGNISQAEDSENWTDGSGQEPPLFPLQRWHSWLLQILLPLVSPNENKDKMHLLMTLWTSSMTASLLQKLNHFYMRWVCSMWEVTLWQKNKSSQGLIHTVNLNCSKHVCVCVCTNWENECHQPFYSRQKLDSFPISNQRANNLVPRHQLLNVWKHIAVLWVKRASSIS